METVAVYKEEQVKVYGITQKADLALGILRFPSSKTELWGLRTITFANDLKRFELVTSHVTDGNIIELHLLFDRANSKKLSEKLTEWVKDEENTAFSIKQPVDLLYLFGPHFQDRFGIADVAFNALLQNNIDLLVSGCAGTSMYFVTSQKQGSNGLKILKDTFLIPTSI